MNDLVQRIQKERSFELVFVPNQRSVAEIVGQFALLYAIAVTGGDNMREPVDRIVRELASNSLHAPDKQATMQLHIGSKGVIVSYSDTGGFFQQAGIDGVLKKHSAGSSGFARIACAADGIEAMDGVVSCVKYGSLTLRETREYPLSGQKPIGAKV